MVLRHDDSTTTLYLPGEELTASGSTVTGTRYYTHNGSTVAVRTPSSVNWIASDAHGTATVMIDASSQNVSQRRFTPFGAPRWPLSPSWPGDRGFVGGSVDGTAGFTFSPVQEATGYSWSLIPFWHWLRRPLFRMGQPTASECTHLSLCL